MNIPPNPAATPFQAKRIERAATRWLNKNDKPSPGKKFIDGKRKARAARQARAFPGGATRP